MGEDKTIIKENKFLPIGTVVLLKGGKKRLMVTGFCVTNESKSDKMWDYCGCLYPEGIITPEQMFLFDHKQIEKIYHIGLRDDEEEKRFKTKLVSAYKGKKIVRRTKEK